ncbi:MAG: lipopolysaccharide biosynthesis protein RfbH [Endomicrobia bacterium]|nr:lipopolysaccharide biosynthesis protein RfbH [Endomicrobiia bacterium]MCL2799009.1 lipopolysaccharide biosynthesis protein RfbH [Endomicrobiia bacterium]
MNEKTARKQILNLADKYAKEFLKPEKYKKGSKINYAGRVFDREEVKNLIDASLDFWLTSGKYTDKFETSLAKFLNIRHCLFVNSGSSANLLAFTALTSPLLKNRAIKRGDEIITVAACFPTTVAPILQFGAVPVFTDITIPQYNIDVNVLKKVLTKKTKAVMIAHTLGNPFDLKAVSSFCKKNNLWLIEDNCDALGAKYKINGKLRYTGTVGDIGTSSFYPAHHITTGEGGAVYTNNPLLHKIMLSLRDWGRDCSCPLGKDNSCGRRFDSKYGLLPEGYDHKYVYSHFGYNLKATEMQAAIGCAQLKKLPSFIKKRNENWQYLRKSLNEFSDVLILPEPEKNSKPGWFGFLITVKENSKITRNALVQYLEKNNIQARMLFAGNITKQPCFDYFRKDKKSHRISENLKNTETVMNNSLWIGVYPAITKKMLQFMVGKIKNLARK